MVAPSGPDIKVAEETCELDKGGDDIQNNDRTLQNGEFGEVAAEEGRRVGVEGRLTLEVKDIPE